MSVTNIGTFPGSGHRKASIVAIVLVSLCALCGTEAWSQASTSPFTRGYRYDFAHRVVAVIDPDPDGSGPIHYGATRNTFDSRGLLTRVEYGELSTWQPENVAPQNWAGFTVFRQVDYTFDSFGRPLS